MSKLCLSTFILLLASFSASAEIYKWVDQYGNSHFTDKPPAGKKTQQVEVNVNTYSAVEITPLVERLSRTDKVVIYSTSWCGICKKAKRYFRKNDIAYVSYDVEKSRTGKRDYKALRGTGVPIIIIDGKRMNGFNVTRFEKMYNKYLKQKQLKDESQPYDSEQAEI